MFKTVVLKECFPNITALERLGDSMVLSGEIKSTFISYGDPHAKKAAMAHGFSEGEFDSAVGGNLLISAESASAERAERALNTLVLAAELKRYTTEEEHFSTIEQALQEVQNANLAAVGVPSEFAASTIKQCLDGGIGVIASSVLPYEQEVSLKRYAAGKGLPMLGGGVNGAIINGKPLGSCVPIREGKTAIVGGGFTADLILAFLLERAGSGVRHLLPCGRRDCFDEQGGIMTQLCLDSIKQDDGCDTVALTFKSGSYDVIVNTARYAREMDKQVYTCVSGSLKGGAFAAGVGSEESLAKLADKIARAEGHEGLNFITEEQAQQLVNAVTPALRKDQKFVRGFFLSEAMCGIAHPLAATLGAVYSNRPVQPIYLIQQTNYLNGNCVIDYGHSDISRSARASFEGSLERNRRIISESFNKKVGLILCDFIAGVGCDERYLKDLANSIAIARQNAEKDGRALPIGVVVFAGENSPVSAERAEGLLGQAGALVFYTADDAVMFANTLLAK